MAQKTMTAPLALIKSNGVTVGTMRGITLRENYQLGRVQGIGELTASELPPLSMSGTLTCDFYEINFEETGIPDAIQRVAPSIQAFVDNVLLKEEGVQVVIFKKVADGVNQETGLIESQLRPYANITGCFLDSEGFDIQEAQVSGHNQSFQYTDPVLFNN